MVGKTPGQIDHYFVVADTRDVITCFKFGDDRFRGLASAEGQICHFKLTLTVVLTTLSHYRVCVCVRFRIYVRMSSALCQPHVLRHSTIVTLVILATIISVAFVISWFTCSASCPLPLVRHSIRHTNNDADVAKRLAGLV